MTALRAKLAENSEQTARSEAKVRDQVRREFSGAMRKLFALSFEQKARIDEYRNHLHAVTLKRISEVRDEAAMEMERIKEKSGAKSSAGMSKDSFYGLLLSGKLKIMESLDGISQPALSHPLKASKMFSFFLLSWKRGRAGREESSIV